MKIVLIFACLAFQVGCARTPTTSLYSAGCDVTKAQEVFSDPVRYFGKRFCGQMVALVEDRQIWLLPLTPSDAARPNLDLALDGDSSRRLEVSLAGKSKAIIYIEGRIDGLRKCFEEPAITDARFRCVPFDRPAQFEASVVEIIELR